MNKRLKDLDERFIKSNSGNQGYFTISKDQWCIRTRLECG